MRHVVLGLAHFRRPARENEVLGVEGVDDVLRGQVLRLKGRKIDIDRHDPHLPAIRVRHRGAPHGRKTLLYPVQRHVLQLLLREFSARDTVLKDRNGRGIIADDERRGGAGRQEAQGCLPARRELSHGVRDRGAGLEEYLDHAHAVVRGGFNVLDIVDKGGDHALMVVDDARFYFLCGETVVHPDHGHDRDVDLRENVRRRSQQHERGQQQKHQRRHHEGVGPA